MKIRNLEDILKKLQHHIQHHQGSSTSASGGGLDSVSPGIPGYDNEQGVSSSMVTTSNGTSSSAAAAGASGTNGGNNSLPGSNLTSPGAAGGAGTHLF